MDKGHYYLNFIDWENIYRADWHCIVNSVAKTLHGSLILIIMITIVIIIIIIITEKKCRLIAGNSRNYLFQILLSSRLLSKNLKIKICKTIVLSTLL